MHRLCQMRMTFVSQCQPCLLPASTPIGGQEAEHTPILKLYISYLPNATRRHPISWQDIQIIQNSPWCYKHSILYGASVKQLAPNIQPPPPQGPMALHIVQRNCDNIIRRYCLEIQCNNSDPCLPPYSPHNSTPNITLSTSLYGQPTILESIAMPIRILTFIRNITRITPDIMLMHMWILWK